MSRIARVDAPDLIHHVINRAIGRHRIFSTEKDYAMFVDLLREGAALTDMRILAYCIMPNHWHLLLHPRSVGDMQRFMHWVTNAHTRKIHTQTKTIGTGSLYQGRYKSFIVEDNNYLLTVLKYIERNAVRARLSLSAQSWKWGSAWTRVHGLSIHKALLSTLPIVLPKNYLEWINTPEQAELLASVRKSVVKGTPFGNKAWVDIMVKQFNLQSTIREVGRPKK